MSDDEQSVPPAVPKPRALGTGASGPVPRPLGTGASLPPSVRSVRKTLVEPSDSSIMDESPAVKRTMFQVGGGGPSRISMSMRNLGARLSRSMAFLSFNYSWVAELNAGGRAKSTCAFVTAVTYTILSGVIFLCAFTSMLPWYAIGAETYQAVQNRAFEALILMACSLGTLFLLYVLDMQYWTGFTRKVGWFIVFLCVLGIGVFTLLIVEAYPGAPLLYFALVPPIGAGFIKQRFFKDDDVLWYIRGVLVGLYLMSICVTILWAVWIFLEDGWWNNKTRTQYVELMGCEFNRSAAIFNEDGSLYELPTGCTRALITWISPGILVAFCSILIIVLTFLKRMEVKRRIQKKYIALEPMAQVFLAFMVLAVISMWIAASVQAAQLVDFSSFLLAISMIALLVSVYAVYAVVGFKYLKGAINETPLGHFIFGIVESDWVKALVVYLFSALFVVVLFLSFVTQCVRKYSPLGKTINHNEKERKMWLKKETYAQIEYIKHWSWGSVLPKTWWIGIGFFTVVVLVGRLTIVFFSFLQTVLSEYSLVVTTLIFVAVGLTMFLLPPVPGVPVYVTGGILLTEQAEIQQGWSFGIALCYTILICYLLKLGAIVLQQKVIGEWMGSRSVYIRSLLNINALELRAMRSVLSRRGLDFKKVVILCSGPDWPTSVLTGVMKLPLTQMLIGSLPVILLVVPVIVAGAVINKSEDGIWKALNPIFLLLPVIIQSLAGMLAFHYIASEAMYKREELLAQPPDQEVLEYEKINELKFEIGKELRKWENLSCFWKVGHVFCTICMVGSCISFQVFGTRTFAPFTIQSTIEDTLDGSFWNFFLFPWSTILFSVFGAGCAYIILFSRVMKCRVGRELNRRALRASQEVEAVPAKNVAV